MDILSSVSALLMAFYASPMLAAENVRVPAMSPATHVASQGALQPGPIVVAQSQEGCCMSLDVKSRRWSPLGDYDFEACTALNTEVDGVSDVIQKLGKVYWSETCE